MDEFLSYKHLFQNPVCLACFRLGILTFWNALVLSSSAVIQSEVKVMNSLNQ